jgi:Rho-binding antiterminator
MDEYRLVSCDFQDRLEALSVLHQPCCIIYRNAANERVEVRDLIVDIYAANKADFLKLGDDTEIRLDKIKSVNGESVSYISD